MANVSDHAKCISLSNQPHMIKSILIDLNPDERNQGLHCYSFLVTLDRCNVSFNTLDDLSNKVCAPNKTKAVHLSVLNEISRIN